MNQKRSIDPIRLLIVLLGAGLVLMLGFAGVHNLFSSSDSPKPSNNDKPKDEGDTTPKEEKADYYIVIDAALGGELKGDVVETTTEAEINGNIAQTIYERLSQDKRFSVELSHPFNESASVENKANKINQESPDFFITIASAHSQAAETSGINVFVQTPTHANHADSMKLASEIREDFSSFNTVNILYQYYESVGNNIFQIKYVDASDETDYGLETWDILQKTSVPGVLVEQVYITNPSEVSTWINTDGYQRIAEEYYKIVCSYLGIKK